MTYICQKRSSRTKKQTTTGSDLGSRQVHIQHVVSVETLETGLPRATVKDQLFIDKLLMADLITVSQHARAEHFIELAQRARFYLSPPNMAGVRSPSTKPADMYNSGLMRFHRAMKRVLRLHGQEGVDVVNEHIIENRPTNVSERIQLLVQVLGSKQ